MLSLGIFLSTSARLRTSTTFRIQTMFVSFVITCHQSCFSSLRTCQQASNRKTERPGDATGSKSESRTRTQIQSSLLCTVAPSFRFLKVFLVVFRKMEILYNKTVEIPPITFRFIILVTRLSSRTTQPLFNPSPRTR